MNLLIKQFVFIVVVCALGGCGDDAGETPSTDSGGSSGVAKARSVNSRSFLSAALNGKLDTVKQALRSGTAVDCTDENQRTALMLAAFNGHVAVMRHLLQAGADVSHSDQSGRTALMFAATGTDTKAVLLLLNSGADVNRKDGGEGWTPLMWAAAEGNLQMVKVLLQAGANPAATDVDGDTASTFALQSGHREVAQALKD